MRISSLQVQGFRSFEDTGTLPMRAINVLLGPNNAGKSSLIRALLLIQEGFLTNASDIRLGAAAAVVKVTLQDVSARMQSGSNYRDGELTR